MTNGHTSTDRGGLRNALLVILGLTTVAGLAEIFLGLSQDCLEEILVALGIANLVAAGFAAASLQKGEPGEAEPEPIEK